MYTSSVYKVLRSAFSMACFCDLLDIHNCSGGLGFGDSWKVETGKCGLSYLEHLKPKKVSKHSN